MRLPGNENVQFHLYLAEDAIVILLLSNKSIFYGLVTMYKPLKFDEVGT